MTDKELMEILSEIEGDCADRWNCVGCKFYKNNDCILKGYPAEWNIEDKSKEESE